MCRVRGPIPSHPQYPESRKEAPVQLFFFSAQSHSFYIFCSLSLLSFFPFFLFLLHISLITPSDLSLTILLCHILLFTLKKIFSKLATLNEGDGRPGHHPPAAGILQGKAHGLHALYTKQFLAANKPLTE